jgi:transglutaminase-like putative cysteine protease
MMVVSECIATPEEAEGGRWVFVNRDDLMGREERLELDREGRIVVQEIPPLFVARRRVAGKRQRVTHGALTDLFVISMPPAPEGETVKVSLSDGVTPGDSVLQFYTVVDDGYLLNRVPDSCHSGGKSTASSFLEPTVTMQADHPAIVDLAKKLTAGMTSGCDIIARCTDYVYEEIEKRTVATFSSALETLEAGFGDCGEHAVLLGALLRAADVPARVVMGLVYIPEKRGYLYHAWVMAQAKERWLFADPAMGRFPVVDGLIPLVIDDSGEEAIQLGKLLGRVEIAYER